MNKLFLKNPIRWCLISMAVVTTATAIGEKPAVESKFSIYRLGRANSANAPSSRAMDARNAAT